MTLQERVLHVGLVLATTVCVLGIATAAAWADLSTRSADAVLGQPTFTDKQCNRSPVGPLPPPLFPPPTAATLCTPQAVAVDRLGRLYVADASNNRVLRWHSARDFMSGERADLVLGQPDFTSFLCNRSSGAFPGVPSATSLCGPHGVAVDRRGRLYVADLANSRILRYDRPRHNGQAADLVLGEPDFTTSAHLLCVGEAGADRLCQPFDVAIDNSGNLYVADPNNSRVVRFDSPQHNGQSANLVLGQPDFTSAGFGRMPDAQVMRIPGGVAVDNYNHLWVSDSGYPRVLRFTSPRTNFQAADLVLGQPDFSSASIAGCQAAPNASTLCDPHGIAVDRRGSLYVADVGANRVLHYARPDQDGQAADLVLGQPNFTTIGCNTGGIGGQSMCGPYGVAVDSRGDLLVADADNDRVLRFGSKSDVGDEKAEEDGGD